MGAEVRNAISQALADGRYLLLDCSNGPLTGNLQTKHIGVSRTPTATHNIIIEETYTTPSGPGTIIGLGNFNRYAPAVSGLNQLVAIQGNAWFDTNRWGAGSSIRCLDFFPAPSIAGTAWGSASLSIYGINTAGLLNVVNRPVVADMIVGINVAPIGAIFGGDSTTANKVRGIWINSAVATSGTWGQLTGILVDPQTSGVINKGIWLNGNAIGSDLVFGTGSGGNGNARIYFNGTNLVINPQVVGTGGLVVSNMKSGATQAAAGALANELWKTNGHATLPNNVVMIGV